VGDGVDVGGEHGGEGVEVEGVGGVGVVVGGGGRRGEGRGGRRGCGCWRFAGRCPGGRRGDLCGSKVLREGDCFVDA